jgi:hypothetical protein
VAEGDVIRLKLIALALCLLCSAALIAQTSRATDAYFTDAKTGAITGTIGSWGRPCTLEIGTSKAKHWVSGQQSPKLMLIAFHDIEGQMRLDFGDEPPGNCNSSPDVFRIVSHDTVARSVTIVLQGPMSTMISRVQIEGGVLRAGATSRVSMQLAIPRTAVPGEYTGDLIVSVQGSADLHIPMVLTVRRRNHKPCPSESRSPASARTPEPAETGTPSDDSSPTPGAEVTATPEAEPTTPSGDSSPSPGAEATATPDAEPATPAPAPVATPTEAP